jgi:hypothetical protein
LLHDAIAQMTTMQARMAALERRGTVPIDQTSRSE